MSKKILLALVFSFCFSLFAQNNPEIKKITIEEAVNSALENNVSIKQKEIDLNLALKKKNSSWNCISLGKISGSTSIPIGEDNSKGNFSVSGGVSLSLAPSLYTQMRLAELSYEQALSDYEKEKRSVELQVRKDFYSILLMKENIAVQQGNIELAKQRYELNRDRYNKGQLSELDMLTSQVSYESLIPSLESGFISYSAMIETFRQTIGLEKTENYELEGSIYEVGTVSEFDIEQSVENSPSVKNLERTLEMQKLNLLASRFSAYAPSVSASYSVSTKFIEDVDFDADRDISQSVTLGVLIPLDGLFPCSSLALGVQSSKASVKSFELSYENTKDALKLQTENSYKKIIQAKNQLESLKATAELARKTYDLTLTAYNHGSKDLLSVQSASDSYLKANTNYQSQCISIMNAVLELENSLGLPFGSLENNKQ